MTRIAVLLTCTLLVACSPTAERVADEPENGEAMEYAVGWIAGVEELTDEIFLDNGKAFIVAPHVNFEMLAPGVRVKLVFRSTPSGRKVHEILPLPSSRSSKRLMSGV